MLHERLGIIDNAHKNLTDLTSQVTTLRDVLANKQSRGAFGQARMEAIVQDGMPQGSYEFQHTLSTGKRPDCVVFLPDQRPLCIDAKFPLEAVTALHDARTDDEKKFASQRLRNDVMKHVSDIAEKYLITGETQDTALMFVPSESVYAEIHDGFDDVIQKAYRARVVLVSPSLLMLAIQVMQQILKDARMRDAADQIRTEVLNLGDDLGRLRDRVLKLQKHFGDANEDVRQILISADKIEKRAGRIEELDFSKPDAPAEAPRAVKPARTGAVPAAAQAAGGGVDVGWVDRSETHRPRRVGFRFAQPTLRSGTRSRAMRLSWPNLLTPFHEPTGSQPSPTRHLLARQPRGLSTAARADRAAARLFLRAAAGAVGIDAFGVDARIRRRSRHHRAVRAGRHALHAEIPVGAAGRCAACAAVHACVRPPPRLAAVFATAADRRDPAAGADRPGALAAVRRAWRAAGRDHVVDAGHRGRCVQGREPAGERTGRRHGVLCRGLSHRHAGLDRGRAVHRVRI